MIAIIFGLTFALCGFFAIGIAWKQLDQMRQMAAWPKVSANIASINVETRRRAIKDNRGFFYMANVPVRIVKYRYTVDGSQHEGELYERTIKGRNNTPVVSEYRVGQDVPLFYNPSNPKIGFVELPPKTGQLVIGTFGVVFVLIGVGVAVFARDAF